MDIDSEINSLAPAVSDGSRRAFMRSGVGAGLAAAVLPVSAQSEIKTDSTGLDVGEVLIAVGDFRMPAYRAAPAGLKNAPVVLVLSEILGVNEYIADVARRLAKQGYFAVAPELFVRQGDTSSYGEIAKLMSEVTAKTPDAQVMSDLDATVAWAKGQGAATEKLGITGFCWGGRTTWMYAAHSPEVLAAVAWYGPLDRSYHPGDKTALEVAGRIKAASLGLYGAADDGIPADGVDNMRRALKAAGNTRSNLILYPDMPHAFHADNRPSYRKEAAEDGWKRCLAWFRAHGVV